jgi:hypothetical protein
MACYDALPASGGTIFVRDFGGSQRGIPACRSSDPLGCGVWIMSPGDPHYAKPPAGWRRTKHSGLISIIGIGGTRNDVGSRGPRVLVAGGGNDPQHPGLWLSGAGYTIFQNLTFASCTQRMGIDSTGNRANPRTATWSTRFDNVYFSVSSDIPGCGPALDIGGNSSENYFTNGGFTSNLRGESAKLLTLSRSSNVVDVSAATELPSSWFSGKNVGIVGMADPSFSGFNFPITITGSKRFSYPQAGPNATTAGGYASSDQGQSIVLNDGPSDGAQVINTFRDDFIHWGGIKVYGGKNGATIYAENIIQEDGISPVIWLGSCVTPMIGSIKNVMNSDPMAPFAAVRVECSSIYGNNNVIVDGYTVDGPAILQGSATPLSATQNPLLQSQSGMIGGQLVGGTNAARRGFSPVLTRFPNLSNTSFHGPGVKGGQPAPDGTSSAWAITTTTSYTMFNLASINRSVTPGDIVICAAWVRSMNPPGFSKSYYNPLACYFSGVATTLQWQAGQGTPWKANGEWDWVWKAFKVSSTSGASGTLVSYVNIGDKNGVEVYSPVLIDIPAGTVADNEAVEYAATLQAFRNDAAVGQVSLLPGEQLKVDSIQVGAGPTINSGLGPPTGTASPGSIYLRRDGAAGSTFYIYAKDGWKARF